MTELQKDRQALVDSIKHWTEDYTRLRLFGGRVHRLSDVFHSGTCALCEQHGEGVRRYQCEDYCGRCPLADAKNSPRSGCGIGSPYDQAWDAEEACDKPAFMRARYNILRRMKRALAKTDKEMGK